MKSLIENESIARLSRAIISSTICNCLVVLAGTLHKDMKWLKTVRVHAVLLKSVLPDIG